MVLYSPSHDTELPDTGDLPWAREFEAAIHHVRFPTRSFTTAKMQINHFPALAGRWKLGWQGASGSRVESHGRLPLHVARQSMQRCKSAL
jgi:hypothetical protein